MIDSLNSPLLESDGYAFSASPGGELARAAEEIAKMIPKCNYSKLRKNIIFLYVI